jgi:hypothetical protein
VSGRDPAAGSAGGGRTRRLTSRRTVALLFLIVAGVSLAVSVGVVAFRGHYVDLVGLRGG